MESEVVCPYCGEIVSVWLDTGGGASQRYVEDCPVCCRPWEVSVEATEEGEAPTIVLRRADA